MANPEIHDTIIVGGGQAGLAMSAVLSRRGREHIILERGHVGERWRGERWKSLHFQLPNWCISLPGHSYDGTDPDGFSHYTDIVRFITDYANLIAAPVRTGTTVSALRISENIGYKLETSRGPVTAANVVIATGPFQRPKRPALASQFPIGIYQTDAVNYREPGQLPGGAVLVVGSGASGAQIADELNRTGRTVFLAVSRHRRVARRFRGKDLVWWGEKMKRFDTAIDSYPDRQPPLTTLITGIGGGYDVDVRRLGKEGVNILGRIQGVTEGTLALADDANSILDAADGSFAEYLTSVRDYVKTMDPAEVPSQDESKLPLPASPLPQKDSLHFRHSNIRAVIWCTGYDYDFGWVKLPLFDEHGSPIQKRGVTSCPGVYFLGLHWMHTFKSGLLFGAGRDAEYIAGHIDATR